MTALGKRTSALFVAAIVVVMALFGLASCSGGGSASSSAASVNANDAVAGVYTGAYIKIVGDSDDARNYDEEFSLTLNADGTGTHARDGMEFDVTWTLDGKDFAMEETFVGDPIEYVGTLSDGTLDIFNGDPDDIWTFEYVYVFGDTPVVKPGADPLTAFKVNFTQEQTAAMSTNAAWGFYDIEGDLIAGRLADSNGAYGFGFATFVDDNGSDISLQDVTIIDPACTPNYVDIIGDYAYYLYVGGDKDVIKRAQAGSEQPETIVDDQCDFMSVHGDRLYFVDGNGQYASCELDGSDTETVIDEAVAWPYVIDDDWVVYQNTADDATLHLHQISSDFDARISDAENATAPVLDGSILWFTAPDADGVSVLHRLDLGAYDADAKTFPDEAGANDVSNAVLVSDMLYPRKSGMSDAPSVTHSNWQDLKVPSYDQADGTKEYRYISDAYIINSDVVDGHDDVYCARLGSAVSFRII